MSVTEPVHAYIIRTEGVCGGRPAIRGTRIAVSAVAFRHRRGESVDDMLEAWPHLNPAQIYDALSYYYDHQKEIDDEVARSLDEDYWQRMYPPGRPADPASP
jgi:uncharacterized protein (DUF433 family)